LTFWGRFLHGETEEDPKLLLKELPCSNAGLNVQYKQVGIGRYTSQAKANYCTIEPFPQEWDDMACQRTNAAP